MKEYFLATGYPQIVVNNRVDKVVFGKDQSVKKTLESGILFVTTYHPKVKRLWKLIRNSLPLLYSDEEVQEVFPPPSHIVRSKLYPVERKVGCRKYGNSRCQVCKKINITDEFTSFITKKTYKLTIVLIARTNESPETMWKLCLSTKFLL